MRASRGMGAINPSKMPKGVKKARRDDTDFTQYAEGGSVYGPDSPGSAGNPRRAKNSYGPGNLAGSYSTMPKADLQAALDVANSTGDISAAKAIQKEQAVRSSLNASYAKGGEIWDQPRPTSLGKPKSLNPKKLANAKMMAKSAGRPYPNLVDNIRAARRK